MDQTAAREGNEPAVLRRSAQSAGTACTAVLRMSGIRAVSEASVYGATGIDSAPNRLLFAAFARCEPAMENPRCVVLPTYRLPYKERWRPEAFAARRTC